MHNSWNGTCISIFASLLWPLYFHTGSDWVSLILLHAINRCQLSFSPEMTNQGSEPPNTQNCHFYYLNQQKQKYHGIVSTAVREATCQVAHWQIALFTSTTISVLVSIGISKFRMQYLISPQKSHKYLGVLP